MGDSLIKAVILDWAGTSIDFGSMAPVKVFVELFRERGIELNNAEVREFMGMDKREHTRRLLHLEHIRMQWAENYGREPGEPDVESLFIKLEPKLAAIACKLSEPIHGAIEFVEDMHSLGVKVGTTTSYDAAMMKQIIPEAEKRGFKPDCIVNASDVPFGRPHPYMCYLNAIRMEVHPLNQMVKIGDTVVDIQEGLNAGMWTIGLVKSGNEVGLSREELLNLGSEESKEIMNKAALKLKQAGAHYVAEGIWNCMPYIGIIEGRMRTGEKP